MNTVRKPTGKGVDRRRWWFTGNQARWFTREPLGNHWETIGKLMEKGVGRINRFIRPTPFRPFIAAMEGVGRE